MTPALKFRIRTKESERAVPPSGDSGCRSAHFSVIRDWRTREDQVVSGVSAGTAERTSVNYREEPKDEALAAVRGFLNAGILSAGVWLVAGALIYWLT
jgi:hypothetical protein